MKELDGDMLVKRLLAGSKIVEVTYTGSYDFSLDIPDSKMRVRNILCSVTSGGWLSRLLWKFIRLELKCSWIEEPIENGH